MNFAKLATLIESNPSHASLSDAELTEWCNDKVVEQIKDRVNSDDFYELIDSSEFTALSQEQQNEVWNTLLLFANSGIPTTPGSRARARLVTIFGASSTTIQAVLADITFYVSRAAAASVGTDVVREGDVQYARTLIGA